jgi:prepilin-type N-terminal cleavage/methylation domain-containing protein
MTLTKPTDAKNGFTLVELMIVALVVAILAAVAIPMMTGNVGRARATEAEAALGMIRSNLRTMYSQTRDYRDTGNLDELGNRILIEAEDRVVDVVPGMQEGDLDGRFFSDDCYTIRSIDRTEFVIECDGEESDALRADEVDGDDGDDAMILTIDEHGEIEHEQGF